MDKTITDIAAKEAAKGFKSFKAWAERPPKRAPTLKEEHEDTQDALGRIQGALNGINAKVLDTARKVFPEKWTTITPHLVDAYSWVGYDIDGRTDITWGDALL